MRTRRIGRRRWIERLAWAGLLAVSVPAAVQVAGLRSWPWELFHHFAPQAGLAAAVSAIVFAILRRRGPALACLLLAGWFGWIYTSAPRAVHAWAGEIATGDRPSATAPVAVEISVLTHNVFIRNWRPELLLARLAERPADVVALQEVGAGLARDLREGRDGYPHRLIADDRIVGRSGRSRHEGIAVLSRYPLAEPMPLPAWARPHELMITRLDVAPGVRPWLVVTHPAAPFSDAHLQARDRVLRELAAVVARLEGPVIVMGDFNVTPWAPAFRDFVEVADLASHRRFPATFPTPFGPFGIPIDHVFGGGGARIAALRVGEGLGSDHRLVLAEVLLPTPAPTPAPPQL